METFSFQILGYGETRRLVEPTRLLVSLSRVRLSYEKVLIGYHFRWLRQRMFCVIAYYALLRTELFHFVIHRLLFDYIQA